MVRFVLCAVVCAVLAGYACAGEAVSDTMVSPPSNEAGADSLTAVDSTAGSASSSNGIQWSFSAGNVTVDGQQWTRFSFSPDIPIGKFGIGLDLELFIDPNGNVSKKGWEFGKDDWYQSLTRKIKYLRYGYENDPFFAKVGGLNNVTLGYGFIVNNFTNMLHYPDEKLLGVQVYLNNIGPLGLTLQTVTPDIVEFNKGGGILGARMAIKPMKTSGMPILNGISVGATYATDLNEYAGARNWKFEGDPEDYKSFWTDIGAPQRVIDSLASRGFLDTTLLADTTYRDSTSLYALLGFDVGVPIISQKFLKLDVYGQVGMVADSNMFTKNNTGWGFGAPGVRLIAGPLTAQLEYRHVKGAYSPGYFGTYYMDERLQRYPQPLTKSHYLDSANRNSELNGIFGMLLFNIENLVTVGGSYQYMIGDSSYKDQRLDLTAALGNAILSKIPKVNRAEVYMSKKNIQQTIMSRNNVIPIVYDAFFQRTPYFYYGYRLGLEITKGASLLWDARYGFKWDSQNKLVPNNNIGITTIVTF
jgi:hypothetical protein